MAQYPIFYEDVDGKPLTMLLELSEAPSDFEAAARMARESNPDIARVTGYGAQPYEKGDETLSRLSSLLDEDE